MNERMYHINGVIIKGFYFKLDNLLTLQQAVELARELESKGYAYHIAEQIREGIFEHRNLGELEKLLVERSR